MRDRKARGAVLLVLVLASALALPGCGIKYTKGENMAYQALAADMGLTTLEAAVTTFYEAADDPFQKDWIYRNLFPALDRASEAILAYMKAADRAMKHEDLGGEVTEPAYLLKEAQVLVRLAQEMWSDFKTEKGGGS